MIKYEPVQVKSILNRLDDKSNGLDGFACIYTLNPYRGCEHACQYCYVLSEKYVPYSKKEEFFYRIQLKSNAPFLLQESLQKTQNGSLMMLGSACDPYQPIEEKYKNTRNLLEIIYRYEIPLHIMTKSELILRDTDLLEKISSTSFLAISFSIAVNDDLATILETRATKPSKRFAAITSLTTKGIRCGVAISPILPFITSEKIISEIIAKAKRSGAKYIFSDDLRLRDTNKERFFLFIQKFYPKLLSRYRIIYSKRVSPPAIFSKKSAQLIEKISICSGLDTTFIGNFQPTKKQLELL
ncbi:MAG: hypothetical protein AB1349_00800 [Elusimicrobiota bacterium]